MPLFNQWWCMVTTNVKSANQILTIVAQVKFVSQVSNVNPKGKREQFKSFMEINMYASITNFIAQNEMQMDMWIEFFKSQSAKLMTDAGAIQISITKTAPNKAVLMNVFPNKEIAMKAREVVADRKKQVKELIKIETTEGEVVFNQNSLTQE